VLGCVANTDAEEHRCLTRLAMARGGLPTRRWWAPGIDGTIAAEVVTGTGDPLVIFELELGDRDRPASTPVAPVADVHVCALGPVSVSIGGRILDGDWLQQRPGQTFRYLLAYRDGAARSEAMADALWPDRGPAAVANVRYCIYKLREQLDDRGHSARSLILRTAGGYRLDPERLVVDVDVFQSKVAAGLAAQRAQRPRAADAALAEALELYRDDFLSDDRTRIGRSLSASTSAALPPRRSARVRRSRSPRTTSRPRRRASCAWRSSSRSTRRFTSSSSRSACAAGVAPRRCATTAPCASGWRARSARSRTSIWRASRPVSPPRNTDIRR
jgi:DNA-binding winged helix-turn-helix (wHTH) protein